MHELSTIYYVIETVEKLMVENDLTKVGSITLEVGEVSGIIPSYLTDFWEWARAKTDHFQDTKLKIKGRHLLPGLQADLPHHAVRQGVSLLPQRQHLPCHRQ